MAIHLNANPSSVRSASGSTLASATGLSPGRSIRVLDPPHTEENYLLKEMGYQIARRYAAKLRRIAILLGFLVPLLALAFSLPLRTGWISAAISLIAAVAATIGILVERWLFFAEATHTVSLYYRG